LAQPTGSMRDLLSQRETSYLLGKTRVTMRSSLENIEVGDFRVESLKEGQSAELPRWVAEALVALNVAQMDEEPFEQELFRSLSREKLMGPLQLSNLSSDFYPRMKRMLTRRAEEAKDGKIKREDYDKLKASSYDLIGMRLSKLLSLSSSSTSPQSLTDKLTPEERAFFALSQSVSREWRDALLEGGA
jgi:GINS complex protein helical bundle domain